MAKRKKNDQEEEQQPAQQYDTTFKDWLRQAARSVLPLFLPGATYEETLDVEIIKPTMRADKVFIVMYRGKKHILHIDSLEKARIQEELKMYDRLWTENPEVQKTRAEGKAEGEIQALQRAVVTVVKARFPALAELAQQKVAEINKPDVLNFLLEQISIEPDEAAVRALLRPIAA